MDDHAKNRGLCERTPPRLIEAYSASRSDSVSDDSTESEDTFPCFEKAEIIDQRDVGVAEEAISSHLITPGSESDSDADSDSVSNDFTESADTVPGCEKKGEADGNVAVMKEMMSAKLTVSVSRDVEVMNYDGVKGLSITDDPLFFGGMNQPPSENGVDSQGPVCFETRVQFERADGDTLSWAAVVKKDRR